MALLRLTSFTVFFLFWLIPYQISTAENKSKVYFKTEHDMITYSAGNGRVWKLFDAQTKIMYIQGIEEGMYLLMLQMDDDNISRALLSVTFQEGKKLTISGFRFGDLADQVDFVYSDSSNLRIPVMEVYRHILKN